MHGKKLFVIFMGPRVQHGASVWFFQQVYLDITC